MMLDCKRTWEAEAVRDGRLTERERHSFEAHAQRCADCSRERQRLIALGELLRASVPPSDEVTLRRMRQSAMERADAELCKRSGPSFGGWRLAAALVAGAALASLLLVFVGGGSQRRPDSFVHVTGIGEGAHWTRAQSDGRESVHLGEGVFRVVVQRAEDDPRVVVHVPEGRIEDIGTVFEVSVHGGRTTQIRVESGAVLFHRDGLPTLRLSAGTVWRAEPAPAARALAPAAPASPPPAADVPDSAAAPPANRTAAAPRKHPNEHARPLATQPAEQSMPEEDRTYLRVLALLRDGRRAEARLLAADYLRQFPNGFRRPEIERIATLTEP